MSKKLAKAEVDVQVLIRAVTALNTLDQDFVTLLFAAHSLKRAIDRVREQNGTPDGNSFLVLGRAAASLRRLASNEPPQAYMQILLDELRRHDAS